METTNYRSPLARLDAKMEEYAMLVQASKSRLGELAFEGKDRGNEAFFNVCMQLSQRQGYLQALVDQKERMEYEERKDCYLQTREAE